MRSPNSCEKQLKYSAMVEGMLMVGSLSSCGGSVSRRTNGESCWYTLRRGGDPLPRQLRGFEKRRARRGCHGRLVIRGGGGWGKSVPGRCPSRGAARAWHGVADHSLSAAGRAQSSLTTRGTVGSNRYGEKPCGDAATGARTRIVGAHQKRCCQVSRAALNDCQGIEPPSSGISIVLSFTASPIHSKNSSLLPTTAIGLYPRPSNGWIRCFCCSTLQNQLAQEG